MTSKREQLIRKMSLRTPSKERFLAIGEALSEAGFGSMQYVENPNPGGVPVRIYICDGIVPSHHPISDGFDLYCDSKKVDIEAVRQVISNLGDPDNRVLDEIIKVL